MELKARDPPLSSYPVDWKKREAAWSGEVIGNVGKVGKLIRET